MTHPEPLGFGFDKLQEERETALLPSAIDEGIAHYRALLAQNHLAMLAGDEKAVMQVRKQANRLAVKLNCGDLAILGGPDALDSFCPTASPASAGDALFAPSTPVPSSLQKDFSSRYEVMNFNMSRLT
jgi:hypothetical protein